jgi:hypothetical protein
MKVSDENRRRGWTPMLRELCEEHGEATIRCFIRDFSVGGRWYGVPLGTLGDAIDTGLDRKTVYAMSATIRALPPGAVEVYDPLSGWMYTSRPISRGVAVRVRDDWELGEWVEDEAEEPRESAEAGEIKRRRSWSRRVSEWELPMWLSTLLHACWIVPMSVVVAAVLPIVVLVGMLWITWDEIANRKENER